MRMSQGVSPSTFGPTENDRDGPYLQTVGYYHSRSQWRVRDPTHPVEKVSIPRREPSYSHSVLPWSTGSD